jgi:hypothetical protein
MKKTEKIAKDGKLKESEKDLVADITKVVNSTLVVEDTTVGTKGSTIIDPNDIG